MLPDPFASLLLGHLTGDYLLQNRWMAMNKQASGLKCLVHCLIYTAIVATFTWPILHGWLWALLIFLSHYPIDRHGLADRWLRMIRGRSLSDFMANGKRDIPENIDESNYHALRAGFTTVVYTVADNTLHLVLMYYGMVWLLARQS